MACLEITNTNTNTNRTDTITDLLKRIEKMQKDAIAANAIGNCNSCIIAPVYNTKPIAIYLCNNQLTATTTDGTICNRFRVEEVRGDITIFRLLATNGEETTCTNNTITCRNSCICCIQCFNPITCTITCPLAV